jgi:sigma-B regulation protein RsbU (phosphoserine phosphatase)
MVSRLNVIVPPSKPERSCATRRSAASDAPIQITVNRPSRFSPQQCHDLSEQAIQFNGFGVVVITPGLQGLLTIARHGVGRERDDGNGPGLRDRLEPARRFPAVDDGKRHIHQNEIRRLRSCHFDSLLPVDREDDPVAASGGLQVLETVRRTYSVADLPIIMTTARDQRADVVRALELGANDYVTKPLDFPVVLARVHTQLSLKRAKRALETAHARMKTDLQAAAKLQRALMPRSLPAVDGARFAWRFQPCNELAGDILDIVQLDESSIGLYLLDVSGHGVQAALLSVTLSRVLSHMADGSVLRQEARDGRHSSPILRPAEVAEQLNRRFPMDATTNQYFTFLYGVLDLKTQTFHHASAGHPGPLHLHRGGEPTVLDASGFAIGWFPDVHYDEQSTSLSPGDRLYFYSDGVIEASNAKGEQFDRSRLIETLRQTHTASLEDSLDTLLNRVSSWCGDAGPADDISVVGIEIVEP